VADRQDSDREVLTSLPRTRPVRRSDKRAARPGTANGDPAAPKRTAKRTAKNAPARADAKPRAQPARKPPAPRPAPATDAATATATDADGSAAPRRKIPPAGYAAPTSQAPEDPLNASADLVATAIQAAGELTQIGFAVGRQTLRSMLDRLPRP